jgi:hypothetical protein
MSREAWRPAHSDPSGLAQGLDGSQKTALGRSPGREVLDPHRRSPLNVNLARQNGFPPVGQAQNRRVTEAPELAVVFRPSTSGTNRALVELLDTLLDAVRLEVIFVDDSPNGPVERIREINRCGRQVCCLQPMGRLASPPPASKGLGQRPPVHRRYGYPPCSTRRCCGRCWRSWRAGRFDLGCILDGKGRRSSFQDPRRSMKSRSLSTMPALEMPGSRHVARGGIGGWDAAVRR